MVLRVLKVALKVVHRMEHTEKSLSGQEYGSSMLAILYLAILYQRTMDVAQL